MPEVPYPERKNGFSIRYFPILKRLSKLYDIDCILILSEEPDKISLDILSKVLKNIVVIKNNSKISFQKRINFLLSRFNIKSPPYAMYDYNAKENAQKIADLYTTNNYAKLIFVTMRNSHTLKRLLKIGVNKEDVIVDAIDSYSLDLSRRKSQYSLSNYLRLYRSLYWELSMVRNCSQTVYISPKDRDFIAKRLENASSLYVVPNGIFIDGYHSNSIPTKSIPSIGFLGNMSYPPNIIGALFTHQIYKEYKNKFGPLNYYIIGRNPVKEIKSLSEDPNIIVTGEVDDIWEYINAVDIFIIHLFTGAGQQNKVLEVMYASKPVLANTISNAGIGAKHNEHLLLSETKTKCTEQLHNLIQYKEQRKRLGENAHSFIESKYSMDTTFNTYLNVLQK